MSKAKRKKKRTAAPQVTGAENLPDTSRPVAPRSVRRPPGLSLLLVLLAALLPYLNSLENGFVLDDQELIVSNPYVQGGAALGALFTADFWEAQNQVRSNHYQPITMVSFALNHRLGGLEPFGYHLTNLLLHILVSVLLLLVLRRLLPRGMLALTAALLFAVHPVHTEAVAAVGGRAHLLAALFFLAAWLVHLTAFPRLPSGQRMENNGWQRPTGLTLLGMALFMFTLLSTGSAVALLPVVLLGDLLRHRKAPPPESAGDDDFFTPDDQPAWRSLGRLGRMLAGLPLAAYAGLLVVFTLYLTLRQMVLGSIAGSAAIPFLDNPLASAEVPVRVMTAVKVLGEYLRLQLWPASLSADYAFNQVKLVTSATDPGFLAALAAGLALIVGATVLWRREGGQTAALGILIFFCTIAPVSNIIFPIGTIMAERLLYLPSIGFCLVLASLFCLCGRELCGPKPAATEGDATPRSSRLWMVILLVSAITLGYAGRTVIRNRDWHDQQTLFLSAAAVSPDSARVHGNLGVGFFEQGKFLAAARSLERAQDIHPDFPLALYILGRARIELDEMENAREALVRAAALRPDHPDILMALGAVDFQLGHLEEAEAACRTLLDLDPGHQDGLLTLAGICRQTDREEEAAALRAQAMDNTP